MQPLSGEPARPTLELSFDSTRGAAAVEYGMLVALIAAVVIATVVLLGESVLGLFESVQWW